MTDEWPMVGREEELDVICRHARLATGHGALIYGDAGTGKTRLAVECAAVLSRDADVLRLSGTGSGGSIPLAAMAAVLPSGTRLDGSAESLRQCADALSSRAESRPLIVVVDDAHLLDDCSALVLRDVIANGAVFSILTARRDTPAPDAIYRLWRDDILQRIDLKPLSQNVIAELLTLVLGGRVDRSVTADLMERSAGRPLILRELVLAARGGGALTRAGKGPWRLAGAIPISQRLDEIVTEQLGDLTSSEQRFLDVVAFAEPLGPAESPVAGDLGTAMGLEKRGLLVSHHNGSRLQISLSQPIHADVLRQRISALRHVDLARDLADAMEKAGVECSQDTLRLASWRLACGGAESNLLLDAALVARWAFDFPLTERLARAAGDSGAGFEAHLLVGQAIALQGRVVQAQEWLASLDAEAGTDDQRGRLATTRLDLLAYDLGRLDDALMVADVAEATLIDVSWRDEVTARKLGLLLAIQGPNAVVEAGQPLVERASGRALAWGCVELAYSLGRVGRLDDALLVGERGWQVHRELPEPFEWSPVLHRILRCDVLAHRGQLDAAEVMAAGESGAGLDAGDLETQALFAIHLAKVVADRGHVDKAMHHAENAIRLARRLGRQQMVRYGLIYLALAHAVAGQAAAAAAVLQEIDDLEIPTTYLTGVDLLNTRAWARAAAGDLWTARAEFASAAHTAADIGDHVGEAAALHSLARLGYPEQALERLRELTGVIDGGLTMARAEHASALIAQNAAELLRVSETFEAMGADLLAAEASAGAAVAWRRADNVAAASHAEWRAEVLAAACHGASTPALRGIDVRSRVTPAQFEVATLAAAGKSNRDIAELLSLSIRTVEGHLQQVYQRLGLSRDQLGSRLGWARPGVDQPATTAISEPSRYGATSGRSSPLQNRPGSNQLDRFSVSIRPISS